MTKRFENVKKRMNLSQLLYITKGRLNILQTFLRAKYIVFIILVKTGLTFLLKLILVIINEWKFQVLTNLYSYPLRYEQKVDIYEPRILLFIICLLKIVLLTFYTISINFRSYIFILYIMRLFNKRLYFQTLFLKSKIKSNAQPKIYT